MRYTFKYWQPRIHQATKFAVIYEGDRPGEIEAASDEEAVQKLATFKKERSVETARGVLVPPIIMDDKLIRVEKETVIPIPDDTQVAA